ncbi:hypothetical protein EDB80DRAFT_108863 [Ilyonectria destructans]|nr:hypothetical protein EDB80DRAFT_108863 [Ilyonectria destructans]
MRINLRKVHYVVEGSSIPPYSVRRHARKQGRQGRYRSPPSSKTGIPPCPPFFFTALLVSNLLSSTSLYQQHHHHYPSSTSCLFFSSPSRPRTLTNTLFFSFLHALPVTVRPPPPALFALSLHPVWRRAALLFLGLALALNIHFSAVENCCAFNPRRTVSTGRLPPRSKSSSPRSLLPKLREEKRR